MTLVRGRRWGPKFGSFVVVLLVLAAAVNYAFRADSARPGLLVVSQPPEMIQSPAEPPAGNTLAGTGPVQAPQPTSGTPAANSSAQPVATPPPRLARARACDAELGALPSFELDGGGGGGVGACSSALPLPGVLMGWEDSFDVRMSGLCAQEGQQMSYMRLSESRLDPEEPACEEAEPYATVRSTWPGFAGPHLLELMPAVLRSLAVNIRKHYRELGAHISARRPMEAALTLTPTYSRTSGEFREPLPGVAVLHNARFYPEGWAHDCRTFVSPTSRGCVSGPPAIPALCDDGTVTCEAGKNEHLRACMPGHESELQRYGRVVTIAQHYGENYFHFVAENLPRLLLMLGEVLADKDAVVHVLDKRPPFVLQALELLGVDAGRVISGDGCARTLFIPEPIQCGSPTVPMLHIARRRLRAALRCPAVPAGGQQYVVLLKRTGTRQVTNHVDVHGALLRLLETEKMELRTHEGSGALREQWDLFASAVGLIGPHGSGMTNMMVMRAGAVVVEFIIAGGDANGINICYLAMSVHMKHIYRAVTPLVGGQETSMMVDPGRAASALQSALQQFGKGNTTSTASSATAAGSSAVARGVQSALDFLTGTSTPSLPVPPAIQPHWKNWSFVN